MLRRHIDVQLPVFALSVRRRSPLFNGVSDLKENLSQMYWQMLMFRLENTGHSMSRRGFYAEFQW